jgi:hypothetical protein
MYVSLITIALQAIEEKIAEHWDSFVGGHFILLVFWNLSLY